MNIFKIRLLVQFIALFSSVAFVAVVEAQPVISNVYPNGTNMFQPSSTLNITASSAAGVTNVTVALTAAFTVAIRIPAERS